MKFERAKLILFVLQWKVTMEGHKRLSNRMHLEYAMIDVLQACGL